MKSSYLVSLVLLLAATAFAGPSQVGGRTSPDSVEELQIDLPGGEHLKNVAGRDGSGCCVFTSVEHCGRWQNVSSLRGFQQQVARHEAGGGWPEKLDAMLAKYAPAVEYVQYTGGDASVLKLALRTGRMPAVTYGYSPRYGGRVAHMVNLVHLSEKWAAVLDNNFPGEDRYEWMAPAEFLSRWQLGGGGWAVVALAAPPPPIPVSVPTAHPYDTHLTPIRPPFGTHTTPIQPPFGTHTTPNGRPDDAICTQCPGGRCPIPAPAAPPGKAIVCDCSAACTCGCQEGGGCPCRGVPAPEAKAVPLQNFGVERARIPNGEERYHLNGRAVPSHEARAAIAKGGTLMDDSGKLHLTLVGTEPECRRVLDDVKAHAALAPWRDKLLVQAYRPDAWSVAGVGIPAHGKPTLLVQSSADATGRAKVLHRQDDYTGGAEALAGALRRADPSYDPKKDPDLRQAPAPAPTPSPPDAANGLASHWWALAGGILALLLREFAPRLAAVLAGLFQRPAAPTLDPAMLERLLKLLEERKPSDATASR